MKKIFVGFFTVSIGLFLVIGGVPWVCAQEEFTLQEITVTAEKREVNVQDIPASVQALVGTDLIEQGKSTVGQMLENVPNLKYVAAEGGRGGHGPNSNIIIRGAQKTQEPGGGSPVAPTTATYVDGVYDGIGGDYDIDRIEVLRGPQGTLYGRSAAGGVVSFHTNNPILEEFGANALAEYGTASRVNAQGALNVPIGETVALRAAFQYIHQDEGYWTGDGVESEIKQGRVKALYQPSDDLRAILSLSTAETQSYGGGWTQYLTAPNTVDYEGAYGDPNPASPTKYEQGSFNVDYDLGDSALSYIGAIHVIDSRGPAAVSFNRGSYMTNVQHGDSRKTGIQEVRWTSDTDEALSWLIGGSYYHYTYHTDTEMLQVSVVGDPNPAVLNAPIAIQRNRGSITEYGIFTEETYELQDNMRITAGLRYDKNKIKEYPGFDFNLSTQAATNGASLNPPNWAYMPYYEDTPSFDLVTYKVRFEYDLTPENMIYVLTGTGYIPAMSQISPQQLFGPGMVPIGVNFVALPYDQEKLTSYEFGSKNRFLDNTLQVNGALFYLDYEGYQEAVNITPDAPPPPNFLVVPVPVKMIGYEMDFTWLITPYDKMSFSAGWLDAKIDGFPDIPGSLYNARDMMYMERLPGIPQVQETLAYDHTFLFGDGSSLVPRAEALYTSAHYVSQLTRSQVEQDALAPYFYQDSYVLFNLGATWMSSSGKYSATAYARNAFDEEYMSGAQTPHMPGDPISVTLGDPRTLGVMFRVKF